jgi:hypothetical protein
MLDMEIERWGIELTMEMPHIEWCFQFEKYVHVVNLKAYKDDLQKVVVFLLVPFSMSQAKIVYEISKMEGNLHSKNCENRKFRVAKLSN